MEDDCNGDVHVCKCKLRKWVEGGGVHENGMPARLAATQKELKEYRDALGQALDLIQFLTARTNLDE